MYNNKKVRKKENICFYMTYLKSVLIEMSFRENMSNVWIVHMEKVVQEIVRDVCNMYIFQIVHLNHVNMIALIWQIVTIVNMHIDMPLK